LILGFVVVLFESIAAGGPPPLVPKQQVVTFHGIRPTDPGGRQGLRNPERGLRTETLIAEPEGKKVWGPAFHLRGKVPSGYCDLWWILDALRYAPYGLTLVQAYCYLDDFLQGPISAEKIALLEKSLAAFRRHGLKAVLRFAYERDTKKRGGPTVERILGHIRQLGPVLRRNADVIFVLQAGFVGAWGEWHSSTHGIERDHAALARIVAAILQELPRNRMTQVRVPKYKRWVLGLPPFSGPVKVTAATAHTGTPAARIGFHDDGFLAGRTDGGTWPEAPYFAGPGNPEFDSMTEESPYVAVDGELFWSDLGGVVDGLRAIKRLRLHHYTSFSLAHSYSERQGKPYSIDRWIQTPLTIEEVRREKLPVSDGYFEDGSGRAVPRTVFEYIRDHLGYRIELLKAELPQEIRRQGEFTVKIDLVNRGFSTFHNPRPVYVTLVSAEGAVFPFPVPGADPRKWQPFKPGDKDYTPLVHRLHLKATLPEDAAPGDYMIGLWLPDASESLRLDPRYAVRVANRDTVWWTDEQGRYGINIMAAVTVR